MRKLALMALIVGLSGCDSLPALEDRDRNKEFAELDAQAKNMQKEIESARRDAIQQSKRQ